MSKMTEEKYWNRAILRFWNYVTKFGPLPTVNPALGCCWLWTGVHTKGGYGQFFARKYHLAHRFSYRMMRGEIAPSLELDHLCKVTNCVNPYHLEPVTKAENIRRSNCFQAVNSRKIHCKNGHPFDAGNTWRGKSGKLSRRSCKACNRIRMKEYRKIAAGVSTERPE